jgi:glycosyltransferase involved in cell wall biosynthesis
MERRIIGLLAVKNAVSQGYPFLESIYSFLNWGDELYISDGNSTDGTLEILKQLAKNRKIHLYNYNWPDLKKGRAIGLAYTDLIKKTQRNAKKGDYLFELQANEVASEKTYDKLRNLPEEFDGIKMFILPYNEFCGKYLLSFSWRMRLAKADNKIESLGDGMHLEILNEIPIRTFLKDMLLQSYRYFKDGEYYSKLFFTSVARPKRRNPSLYKPIPLAPPIFRYGLIFPKNMTQKISGHGKLYKTRNYIENAYKTNEMKELLEQQKDVKKFYTFFIKKYFNLLFKNEINHTFKDIIKRTNLEGLKHPEIMKPLLNKLEYPIRKELIEKIKSI